jgi:hypothetical protein
MRLTIQTHAEHRATARKAINLWNDLYNHQCASLDDWSDRTLSECAACWRALCQTVDQVVYAAGGHREHLTWHLFGATLTAKDLWGDLSGSVLYGKDLPSFLLYGGLRSGHDKLAITAFWANQSEPLPIPRRKPSLPALEGRATEAEMKGHEAARQTAIARFAALRAAKGGV